jgi:hypothetical protein
MPKDNDDRKPHERRLFFHEVYEPSTDYEDFDHDQDEYSYSRPGRGGYRPLDRFYGAFVFMVAVAAIFAATIVILMLWFLK